MPLFSHETMKKYVNVFIECRKCTRKNEVPLRALLSHPHHHVHLNWKVLARFSSEWGVPGSAKRELLQDILPYPQYLVFSLVNSDVTLYVSH